MSMGEPVVPPNCDAGRHGVLSGSEGVSMNRPLLGKTVIIVHPAWHSCGSYQVFDSQARAYRSLGAAVVSLAIADLPGNVDGSRASRTYYKATDGFAANTRLFTGMPLRKILSRDFRRAAKQWLHGNDAAMRVEVARQAVIPGVSVTGASVDLIHCNHFFCMPAAVRLRERHACPILLDTHDLQAWQYALRNLARIRLPPAVRMEAMLDIELDAMRQANLLIHLNDEEAAAFKTLVPDKPHALIYPAVAPMPVGPGGQDPIIVASANYPNYLGLRWFLREVLPLAASIPVQIFGNIDREFRARESGLYKNHAGLFRGRVDSGVLHEAYRNASAVLLPATAGHGISIKTIEALSSGAPLVATSLAFRGLGLDAANLQNVMIAEDGPGFAAALRRAYANRLVPGVDRQQAATRSIYDERFAFDVYRAALQAIVMQALKA